MIPFSILFIIFIFVVFYMIGLLLSVIVLVDSIRKRKVLTAIIALLLIAIYVVFGLSLI